MDESTAATVGAWLLSSLTGGGIVGVIGYLALKDKLTRDLIPIFAKRSEVFGSNGSPIFAEVSDLDAVGGKVTGAISMASMAKDRADANADAIIRLQEGEKHRWEPVLSALERINTRLDAGEKRDERHATMLDQLERRMDRDNDRRTGQ